MHAFDEKEPLALCGLADDLTSGSQPDPAHLRQQVGGQARGERGRQRAERGAAQQRRGERGQPDLNLVRVSVMVGVWAWVRVNMSVRVRVRTRVKVRV